MEVRRGRGARTLLGDRRVSTAVRARARRLTLRTSILVPCIGKHAHLLPELIANIDRQVVAPDEVIIAISDARSAQVPQLRSARSYKLVILADSAPAYAGKNRNRAADQSTGDLLIYQDADDIPHPQRVAVAREVCERFDVQHLMHTYEHHRVPASFATWLAKRFPPEHAAASALYERYTYTHQFTNGNIITTRGIFRRVRWPESLARGQDVAYNKAVALAFPKTMARISVPLLGYRQYLSSAR